MIHAFTMPGDWNHIGLLLRLMEVVESPWQATMDGFVELATGERVDLAYAEHPIEGLASAFERGTDPTRPLPDDVLLEAVAGHRSVAQVRVPPSEEPALVRLERGLRATSSVVDGGALGVLIGVSGLAYEADAFQGMVAGLDGEDDRTAALFRIMVRYQVGAFSTTLGMAALGLPDVVLPDPLAPERAVAAMEREAERLLAGETLRTVPDPRSGGQTNPYGVVLLGSG